MVGYIRMHAYDDHARATIVRVNNHQLTRTERGENAGSVETTDEEKRKLAAESLAYNLSKPAWRDMFPQLHEAAAAAGLSVPQLPPQVHVRRFWLAHTKKASPWLGNRV
jgi:hypothetical protein